MHANVAYEPLEASPVPRLPVARPMSAVTAPLLARLYGIDRVAAGDLHGTGHAHGKTRMPADLQPLNPIW